MVTRSFSSGKKKRVKRIQIWFCDWELHYSAARTRPNTCQRQNNHHVQAPKMTNPEEIKQEFYKNLREVLLRVPCTYKLKKTGDFNARVEKWTNGHVGLIRVELGSATQTANFFWVCSEHNLVITNTIGKRKEHRKTTQMEPYSKHWHLLYYVTVRTVLSRICRLYPASNGVTILWKFAYLHDPQSYVGWSLELLVGPPTLKRSKGRDQTKSDPLVLQAGVGRRANDTTT